jgi:hypothetical protein
MVLTSIAAAPAGGFWVQVETGGTVAVDGAPNFGSIDLGGSIAAIPGRNGYFIVSSGGRIFARGDAPQLCDGLLSDCSGFPKNAVASQSIVGAAATPSGNGLWALSRDRKVWTAGDARSHGDVQSDPSIPTGIAATPSGNGYYIVMKDGGVFSFGDALFYGSNGGKPPGGHPVTGIAQSIGDGGKVNGYWLVADDGGVFTYGSAPFWGSPGGRNGGSPVTSIVSFPAAAPNGPPHRTRGYAWVHQNGQVAVVHDPLWVPARPQPGLGTPPPPDA